MVEPSNRQARCMEWNDALQIMHPRRPSALLGNCFARHGRHRYFLVWLWRHETIQYRYGHQIRMLVAVVACWMISSMRQTACQQPACFQAHWPTMLKGGIFYLQFFRRLPSVPARAAVQLHLDHCSTHRPRCSSPLSPAPDMPAFSSNCTNNISFTMSTVTHML